ncbi:hypothetical protein B0H66DRAFT_644162 [Apodospora peruviana]|uniref:Uncharacterized protein n=1 Tax=Apodospora peruviana TaxID=516989 RepID=A0AAE0HUC3_9PEZI|nr:hypothetical protein B0H66DRAFT_644162 [Apodospora peruviana]
MEALEAGRIYRRLAMLECARAAQTTGKAVAGPLRRFGSQHRQKGILRLGQHFLAAGASCITTDDLFNPGGYIDSNLSPFFSRNLNDVKNDVWQISFAKPNATAKASVDGWDMSSKYPGKKSDKWEFSLMIADDVPHPQNAGKYFTGTWIQLDAPDKLVKKSEGDKQWEVTQDASWEVCQEIWVPTKLHTETDKVDPTCNGVLPPACLEDMQTRLSEDFKTHHFLGVIGKCPMMQIPDSCSDAWGGTTSQHALLAVNQSSSTGTFNYARLGQKDDAHAIDDTTAYDASIRQVYVLGLTWGYSSPDLTDAPVGTSLTCLRASDFAEGSRRFQDATANTDDKNKPGTTTTSTTTTTGFNGLPTAVPIPKPDGNGKVQLPPALGNGTISVPIPSGGSKTIHGVGSVWSAITSLAGLAVAWHLLL